MSDFYNIHPLNDGVHHVNIYSKGKTWLGRELSNFSYSPFLINPYGKFDSVEGFWFWLGTGKIHNELRNLHGWRAKKVGSEYERIDVPNFNEEIKRAIKIKILSNNKLKEELFKNKLPLEHYYWYGDENTPKIYPLPQYRWIVDFIENLKFEKNEHENQIVHCKKEKFDVYIGRPSKWGNPFSHIDDRKTLAEYKAKTREESISKYRDWILNGDGKHLLKDMGELKGKTLGCWCKPLPCHGEVLVEILKELENEK